MACNGAFLDSHFFWIFVSGLYTGFALSWITRSENKADNSNKKRSWKWVLFLGYLSLSVVLALAGAFLPSSLCTRPIRLSVSERFLDDRLLYMYGAAAGFGFLTSRFKRAGGIPGLFLLFITVLLILVLLLPWSATDEDGAIAQFRILSQDDSGISVELIRSGGDVTFQHLEGSAVQIHLDLLIAEDYFFFIKKPFLHRLAGFVQQDGIEPVGPPARVTAQFWRKGMAWLQERIHFVPGWDIRTVIISGESLIPLYRYGIYIDSDLSAYLQIRDIDRENHQP